eukprot:363898-Chlamydomonas_euryale.AAC.3
MLRPLWPAPEGATAASASALDKGIAGCGIVRPDTGGAAARAACLFLPPRAAAPAVAASPSPPPNAASVPPAAWREALVSQRPEPARPPSLPSSSLPPQLLTSNDATRESPAFENACNAALARPAWMAAASGSMPCSSCQGMRGCLNSISNSTGANTSGLGRSAPRTCPDEAPRESSFVLTLLSSIQSVFRIVKSVQLRQ